MIATLLAKTTLDSTLAGFLTPSSWRILKGRLFRETLW
jgi:hypothetical protein